MIKIRLFALIALAALGFSAPALAGDAPAKPPFTWPSAYSASWDRKCMEGDFHETYYVDGLHARTDTKSDKVSYAMIFNSDTRQAIVIVGGRAQIMSFDSLRITSLGAPRSLFPTEGTWQNLGKDDVNGKPAAKYQVTPPAPQPPFIVWLSEDGTAPLRVKLGDMDITLLSYTPGPQDPKLFEAPKKD